MKKSLLTLLLMSILSATFAQDITGAWYGKLNVQGTTLSIVYHITGQAGNYATTWDSPDQGANNLATSSTTFINNELTIAVSQMAIKYVGHYYADSTRISGIFTQGPATLPLVLTRNMPLKSANAAPKKVRPQDPVNFPYNREEVNFENKKAGDVLAGTLTMPKDGKFSKVAVLITGSGPQNRDEELVPFNHRPFLVLSDWLTRQGIAVLRYDDRGTAKSTGNFSSSTTADFADDAEAAVRYLQSRPDMKGTSIGLIGHSEGGMIAPIIAARNKQIAFIVLLAGPGVPGTQLMLQQMDDQTRLTHVAPEIAVLNHQFNQSIYKYIHDHPQLSDGQLKAGLTDLMIAGKAKYPGASSDTAKAKNLVEKQAVALANPWYRYFITFDPSIYLTKVHCPVLALDGDLDSQVSAAQNLPAIKADLIKAGNKNFKIVQLEGINHLMQKATTGAVEEYGQIEETIDPIVLTTITDWINQLK